MKVFIIGSVRNATEDDKNKLLAHAMELEAHGHVVHLPQRDTNQGDSGLNICTTNARAIENADEVHVFYSKESQGTHFDMGVAFAFGKRIRVIENIPLTEGKSYQRMLTEWEKSDSHR